MPSSFAIGTIRPRCGQPSGYVKLTTSKNPTMMPMKMHSSIPPASSITPRKIARILSSPRNTSRRTKTSKRREPSGPCELKTRGLCHLSDRVQTRFSLGQWSGYVGDSGMFPSEPMMRLDIHASSPNMFVASGTIPIGTRFNVSGTTASPNGSRSVTYHFQLTYAARYWPRIFRGRLSDAGRELSGVWTCKGNETEGTFLFRRLPPGSMRFWPLLTDVESRKPLTLWRFALSAVQDQVRRKMLSINLLRERRAIRQRYLRAIRVGLSTQLSDEKDRQTLIRCYLFLTPSEARYYYSVYESMQSISPKHL